MNCLEVATGLPLWEAGQSAVTLLTSNIKWIGLVSQPGCHCGRPARLLSLCSPQISHGLAWDRNRVATVGGRPVCCHSAHLIYHMDWPGIATGLPLWEAGQSAVTLLTSNITWIGLGSQPGCHCGRPATLLSLCSPHVSHGLAWDRNRVATVGGLRLAQ
jgi:hypothetical protein